MTAPSEVNSTFTAGPTSADTGLTANIGTNQNNDILVAFVWCTDAAGSIATPSGYAEKFQGVRSAGQTSRGAIFWKRTSGGESSQAFSWTNAVNRSGAMISVIRGCPTSGDPFDHIPSPTNYAGGAKSAQNAPQAVTTVADTLALMFYWGWTSANDTGSSITITSSQGQGTATQGRTSNRFPMAVTSEAISGTGTMDANSALVNTSAGDADGWFHTVTLKPVAGATPQALNPSGITAAASVSGALRSPWLASGSVVGAASVTGPLISPILLNPDGIAGSATVAGALQSPWLMVGSVAGAATVAGELASPWLIDGAVVGAASVSGEIGGPAPLSGDVAAGALMSGLLSSPWLLVGSVVAVSVVNGELDIVVVPQLAGAVAGVATVIGALRSPGLLTGSVLAVAIVTGNIRFLGQAPPISLPTGVVLVNNGRTDVVLVDNGALAVNLVNDGKTGVRIEVM